MWPNNTSTSIFIFLLKLVDLLFFFCLWVLCIVSTSYFIIFYICSKLSIEQGLLRTFVPIQTAWLAHNNTHFRLELRLILWLLNKTLFLSIKNIPQIYHLTTFHISINNSIASPSKICFDVKFLGNNFLVQKCRILVSCKCSQFMNKWWMEFSLWLHLEHIPDPRPSFDALSIVHRLLWRSSQTNRYVRFEFLHEIFVNLNYHCFLSFEEVHLSIRLRWKLVLFLQVRALGWFYNHPPEPSWCGKAVHL